MKQIFLKLSTVMMLIFGTSMGADMPGAAGQANPEIDTRFDVVVELHNNRYPKITIKFPRNICSPEEPFGNVIAEALKRFYPDFSDSAVSKICAASVKKGGHKYVPMTDPHRERVWNRIRDIYPDADKNDNLAELPYRVAKNVFGSDYAYSGDKLLPPLYFKGRLNS